MSNDAIQAMRQAMAARYAATKPEEKPQVRICADCRRSVYDSKVCPQSGRLHNLDEAKILGGSVMDKDKRTLTGQELMAAIDAVRVKWQPARTAKVLVDGDAASIFQTFVLQHQWRLQRFGILYGTVDKAAGAVSVHCVYEPEQDGSPDGFRPLPDEREARVDRLAGLLGLQRVGLIASHPARDAATVVLTGQELTLLAREQSRFGDHCVLLTVAPNPETQQIQAQAWQASEQCVHLFQIGLLSPHPDDVRFVYSTRPLELAQEDRDAKGHQKCVIREPNHAIDTRWMTAYCAVESFSSDIIGNRFVRISRPGEAPPDCGNLRNFFQDPKRKRLPFVERCADFHVLVFLMERILDIKTDMPALCAAVVRKDAAAAEALEEIVRDHIRSATQ